MLKSGNGEDSAFAGGIAASQYSTIQLRKSLKSQTHKNCLDIFSHPIVCPKRNCMFNLWPRFAF